jgi:hypothetical protein
MKLIEIIIFCGLQVLFNNTVCLSQTANNPSGDMFRIDRIIPDKKTKKIRIQFTAINSYGNALSSKLNDISKFTVKESTTNQNEIEYGADKIDARFIDGEKGEEVTYIEEPLTVLFLLDMSGSMNRHKVTGKQIPRSKAINNQDTRLSAAKNAIAGALNFKAMKAADVKIALFSNETSPTTKIDSVIFNREFAKIYIDDPANSHTALYKAIYEKTEELKLIKGQKVIILLTDGKNEPLNTPKPKRLKSRFIIDHIASLDSTFQIYPIGIGSGTNESFLKSITNLTKNRNDKYKNDVAPTDLERVVQRTVTSLTSNFELIITPRKGEVYAGEPRNYLVTFDNDKYLASKRVILSRADAVWIPNPNYNSISEFQLFIIGLIFIAGLLGLLIFLVPIIVDFLFKKNHVRYYREVKRPGYTPKDPVMLTSFNDNDQVVKFGNRLMLYDTWKYIKKEQQGDLSKYAEFFEHEVKGNFFSQNGIFKRLNWLWFGTLGGLLAWCFGVLLTKVDTSFLLEFFQSQFDTEGNEISYSLYGRIISGVAIGLGITTMLSIVEERGQSRKFSFQRVLLRVLIAIVITPIVFFIEGLLTTNFIHSNYLGGLIGFSLFGIALGWIVTRFSSIETINGVKGGGAAGLIAFHIYYLLVFTPLRDFLNADISRILSLILFGGVLGFIMFAIVSKLESFEIAYFSPKEFSGQVNGITNFLKSEKLGYVLIGTHPKECKIWVKWDKLDPSIKERHAKLLYDKGTVYIQPEEGSVSVNGQSITGKVQLKNNDMFILGPNTTMQFRSKKVAVDEVKNNHNQGNVSSSNNNRRKKIKPNIEVRKQIEVKRKK